MELDGNVAKMQFSHWPTLVPNRDQWGPGDGHLTWVVAISRRVKSGWSAATRASQ